MKPLVGHYTLHRRTRSAWTILVASLIVAFLFTPAVKAADNQVEVLVGDVCPNIPGLQTTLPTGMQLDGSGNCFTPAPPAAPDTCPNITGYQSAIPKGYYRNPSGNCATQTNPPQDVCSNLSGTQSAVPDGMYSDEGKCLSPAKDVCPNIPGPQSALPDEMKHDKTGNCFTPTITPPTDTTDRADSPSTPGTIHPLPYYIIATLALLALAMIAQTLRETSATTNLLIFFRRKRETSEAKDTFAVVSLNYIQTLTSQMQAVIKNEAIDGPASSNSLGVAIASLQTTARNITDALTSGEAFRNPTATILSSVEARMLSSPLFWIPVLVTASLIVTANYLLNAPLIFLPGELSAWIQLGAFALVSTLLFLVLRWRHIRHLKLRNAEQRIHDESTLDIARNNFLQQSYMELKGELSEVDNRQNLLQAETAIGEFRDAYIRLAKTIARLGLLPQILLAPDTDEPTASLRDAINNCLVEQQDSMDEKQLTLTDAAENYTVTLPRTLLESVINSIFDSAIRFHTVGGNITITTEELSEEVMLSISDNGTGLSQEKLEELFGLPLNPNQDSVDQDLRLGLFLGKLVVAHFEGSLSKDTVIGKGTRVSVTLPLAD